MKERQEKAEIPLLRGFAHKVDPVAAARLLVAAF
jgi:hypothetical protein